MKVQIASKFFTAAMMFMASSFVHAKVEDSVGIVTNSVFSPPPSELSSNAYIELIHQKQEPNLCVPTSASMVLQQFGTAMSPREIKMLASKKRHRPNQEFDDFTATMFVDLISGLSKIGFEWEQRTYRNTKAGFRDGLEEIKKALDAGKPVLADTSLYGGHTLVIAGYNDRMRTVIAVDPNISAPGLRVLSYDDFEDVWNSRGVGFNGRGAVFTSAKRQ